MTDRKQDIGTPASIRSTAGSGLGRNFAAMLVWQVGTYLVPLATFPYLTRILGPSGFGALGYVTAIAVYGMVFTEWGFNLSGPQAVVSCRDRPDQINELIWSTIGAKACLCLISFAGLLLLLHFDSQAASMKNAALLAWLAVVGNVFTLNWLLQGLERFSMFATVALVGRFITLPLTFIFVRHSGDVASAVAIQSASSVLTGLLSVVAAIRLNLIRRPDVSLESLWRRIKEGTDMFVSTASVSLFSATNFIILGNLGGGTYQVGLYAAADRLKTVGNMVPAQINTVLYPRVSALFLEGIGRRRAAAKLTLLGVVATVVTTASGVALLGSLSGPVTRIILGKTYAGSGAVLTLLCLATLFGNVAYILGLQVLVPFGGTRWRSRVMLAAGTLNIALAFMLVPHFGATGAAMAFLVAEATIFSAYLALITAKPILRGHFTQLLIR
jgi:O-antigen/teichoic acid export membrane protein